MNDNNNLLDPRNVNEKWFGSCVPPEGPLEE